MPRCVTKGSTRVLSHSSLRWCSWRPGGVWHFAWNRGFTLEELGEESCILSPCSAGARCDNRRGIRFNPYRAWRLAGATLRVQEHPIPAISRRRGCMDSNRSNQVVAFEQHFSPAQLAEMWGLSPDFIREQFRDEAAVLKIDRPEKMHKRAYCSLRIPRSVAHRVHCRLLAK
jgi:hypothetical protein